MFMTDKEIATYSRALGIIEGVASLIDNDTARTELFLAVEMLDEVVKGDGAND